MRVICRCSPEIEISADRISGGTSARPPSPSFTSDSAKLVWLVFVAGFGMGNRNLLPLLPAVFDTLDSVGDALPGESVPEVSTEFVRDLELASSTVSTSTVNRFGSEKSGNASSSSSAVVTTDRRTDELGVAGSVVMLKFL